MVEISLPFFVFMCYTCREFILELIVMKATDRARIILYRCHEKGLEVLLISPNLLQDDSVWRLPTGKVGEVIELDPIELRRCEQVGCHNIAIEADWHQIPSVRGIIKHDVRRLGKKVKTLSEYSYLNVKEALKEVMPEEYAAIKELKDILTDRMQARMI